jgi:hypothetical protein
MALNSTPRQSRRWTKWKIGDAFHFWDRIRAFKRPTREPFGG